MGHPQNSTLPGPQHAFFSTALSEDTSPGPTEVLSLDCCKILLMMESADLASGIVKVDHLNAVVVGIHPVEDALWDVQTQAIRPQQCFAGQEHISVRAIHPSTLNFATFALFRVLLPVGPIHPPEEATRESNVARQKKKHIYLGIS